MGYYFSSRYRTVKEFDVASARFGRPVHVRAVLTVDEKPSWVARVRALALRNQPLEQVDVESWCLISPTPGQQDLGGLLAQGCDEYAEVYEATPNENGSWWELGILVRHADLAERMLVVRRWPAPRYDANGFLQSISPSAPIALIDRTEVDWPDTLAGPDAAGVATAGPYPVAAAIINQCHLHHIRLEWEAGRAGAVATGTNPEVAQRRSTLYKLLDQGEPVTATDLELWDRHAVEHGVHVVALAIQAGYGCREITPELLTDEVGLKVAAALNQNAA